MNIDPTDISTLKRAYDIARQKLNYVYLGNVPVDKEEGNTICPNCKKELIKREMYNISITGMDTGNCKFCKTKIYGKFE